MLVSYSEIQKVCDEIVEKFHPEKVILFGSYAYGTPTEDSDVDLFVLMDHDGRELDAMTKIRVETKHRFPMDLIVRSPEVLKKRLEWKDWFLLDIVNKGKVLYDAHNT
ncbi:MAG: nucleotidyltransferase domain-containing protein [Calditrichaeota bacterium]|nr:nucleotidyltransferase domain-containing protein [Calditrichota bacterium]MCB9369622.1 nucleotidyltransferase domain-containing protein [Calditrichota bacterium]